MSIDDRNIELVDGEGKLELEAGLHLITWWFVGNPGTELTLKTSIGEKLITQVKSRVPVGQTDGAGTKRFEVP